MEYIKDIYRDEIRDGFLVTADRKKIWQVEMELLEVLDRICAGTACVILWIMALCWGRFATGVLSLGMTILMWS